MNITAEGESVKIPEKRKSTIEWINENQFIDTRLNEIFTLITKYRVLDSNNRNVCRYCYEQTCECFN